MIILEVRLLKLAFRLACALLLLSCLYAAHRTVPLPFRQFPGDEYRGVIPLPPDFEEKTEWVFARLMYPPIPDAHFGHAAYDWHYGRSSWTNDYPRADRHFAQAIRRLTRLSTRSVEQPVNLDDGDDVYNYPWLYAVFVGEWNLTDREVKTLREYLMRGGFLVCDDFWGTRDWEVFEASMKRVFPDRPVVDLPADEPVFHTVYDIGERYRVPGEWSLRTAVPYRNDGYVAHWRGIYDDKNRVMVAISFNSDLGDSWEWADDSRYPEEYSALGIRVGVNYILYSMSH